MFFSSLSEGVKKSQNPKTGQGGIGKIVGRILFQVHTYFSGFKGFYQGIHVLSRLEEADMYKPGPGKPGLDFI